MQIDLENLKVLARDAVQAEREQARDLKLKLERLQKKLSPLIVLELLARAEKNARLRKCTL